MSQFTYCCSHIFNIYFIILATFKFILFLISSFQQFGHDMLRCSFLCFYSAWSLQRFLNVQVTLSKFGKFPANFFYALSALHSLFNPSGSLIVCFFNYLFLSTSHLVSFLFLFLFVFIFGFFVVIHFIYFFVFLFSLFQVCFLCVLQLT